MYPGNAAFIHRAFDTTLFWKAIIISIEHDAHQVSGVATLKREKQYDLRETRYNTAALIIT